MLRPSPIYAYPPEAYQSIKSPALTLENQRLPVSSIKVRMRVVEAGNDTFTHNGQAELTVREGSLEADPAQDGFKIAHINCPAADQAPWPWASSGAGA